MDAFHVCTFCPGREATAAADYKEGESRTRIYLCRSCREQFIELLHIMEPLGLSLVPYGAVN